MERSHFRGAWNQRCGRRSCRRVSCRTRCTRCLQLVVGNKFSTHTPLAEAGRRLPRPRPLECESRFCFPGKQQRLVTGPAPPAVKPMPPLPHSPAFRLRAPAPVLRCQHPVPPSEPPPKRFRPLPSQAPDRDPEKETKVKQNRLPFSVAVFLAVPSWAETCTLCNHKTFSLTYLSIYICIVLYYTYVYLQFGPAYIPRPGKFRDAGLPRTRDIDNQSSNQSRAQGEGSSIYI